MSGLEQRARAAVQHKSGLFIPADSFDKNQRTLPRDDMRRFQRHLKFAHAHGIQALYTCAECKQGIRIESDAKIVDDAPGGRFSLHCSCSVWVVR